MRKRLLVLALALVMAIPLLGLAQVANEDRDAQPIEFATIDVVVDPGDETLAAYQVEIEAVAAAIMIVGIEGGEHPEFAAPPYYDPAAMRHERVIIAAFSTAARDALPRGASRVATIHVQITGGETPRFEATLTAAAAAGGREIDAKVHLKRNPKP